MQWGDLPSRDQKENHEDTMRKDISSCSSRGMCLLGHTKAPRVRLCYCILCKCLLFFLMSLFFFEMCATGLWEECFVASVVTMTWKYLCLCINWLTIINKHTSRGLYVIVIGIPGVVIPQGTQSEYELGVREVTQRQYYTNFF